MGIDHYYRDPERVYNIFYLDDDPEQAARYHCDRHLAKALLWSAQILSMVWFNNSVPKNDVVDSVLSLDWAHPINPPPYGQLAHSDARLAGQRIYFTGGNDHPCVAWAGQYGGNYDWLYRLGMALLAEFRHRFERIHSTQPVLRVLELLPPSLIASACIITPPPPVVPDEFVVRSEVESYRRYYDKLTVLNYTNRNRPEWL